MSHQAAPIMVKPGMGAILVIRKVGEEYAAILYPGPTEFGSTPALAVAAHGDALLKAIEDGMADSVLIRRT